MFLFSKFNSSLIVHRCPFLYGWFLELYYLPWWRFPDFYGLWFLFRYLHIWETSLVFNMLPVWLGRDSSSQSAQFGLLGESAGNIPGQEEHALGACFWVRPLPRLSGWVSGVPAEHSWVRFLPRFPAKVRQEEDGLVWNSWLNFVHWWETLVAWVLRSGSLASHDWGLYSAVGGAMGPIKACSAGCLETQTRQDLCRAFSGQTEWVRVCALFRCLCKQGCCRFAQLPVCCGWTRDQAGWEL